MDTLELAPDGTLFGMTNFGPGFIIHTIDPLTGRATAIAQSPPIGITAEGLDFFGGTFYTGNLFDKTIVTVDPFTGELTTIATPPPVVQGVLRSLAIQNASTAFVNVSGSLWRVGLGTNSWQRLPALPAPIGGFFHSLDFGLDGVLYGGVLGRRGNQFTGGGASSLWILLPENARSLAGRASYRLYLAHRLSDSA